MIWYDSLSRPDSFHVVQQNRSTTFWGVLGRAFCICDSSDGPYCLSSTVTLRFSMSFPKRRPRNISQGRAIYAQLGPTPVEAAQLWPNLGQSWPKCVRALASARMRLQRHCGIRRKASCSRFCFKRCVAPTTCRARSLTLLFSMCSASASALFFALLLVLRNTACARTCAPSARLRRPSGPNGLRSRIAVGHAVSAGARARRRTYVRCAVGTCFAGGACARARSTWLGFRPTRRRTSASRRLLCQPCLRRLMCPPCPLFRLKELAWRATSLMG